MLVLHGRLISRPIICKLPTTLNNALRKEKSRRSVSPKVLCHCLGRRQLVEKFIASDNSASKSTGSRHFTRACAIKADNLQLPLWWSWIWRKCERFR